MLDKTTIKLTLVDNEIFTFSFNFKLKAPNCSLTMHQQVIESVVQDPLTNAVTQISFLPALPYLMKPKPDFLQPQTTFYRASDTETFSFQGSIHLGNFDRNSSMIDKRRAYYPIAVSAFCTYPEDAERFYHCIFFFDLSTAQASVKL